MGRAQHISWSQCPSDQLLHLGLSNSDAGLQTSSKLFSILTLCNAILRWAVAHHLGPDMHLQLWKHIHGDCYHLCHFYSSKTSSLLLCSQFSPLSGDDLLFSPKVSWSSSNSDLLFTLKVSWSSSNSNLLPVPETLQSSSYSKSLLVISNTATCSFYPNTSPDTSSKGRSKTSASSKGNSETSSNSAPSDLTSAQNTLRVKVEIEWLLQHPILRVISLDVKLLRSPSDCWDSHLIAEIPIWSKINPLLLPWLCSDHPLRFQHYTTIPPNSDWPLRPLTLSLSFETSEWPLRSLTTFLSSLFCFSPLALCSCFHIPVSVFIFPFLIYCAVSVLLFSCSSLHSTIVH